MIYQQMDTRHKLHETFKQSLFLNMPEVGDELLVTANFFIEVHRLGTELFGVLGDCWPVFMHPENYMSEFKTPELRLKMTEILRQIVETNIKVCEEIENIISAVNRRLLPYRRIERVIIPDEPMEMAAAKKIKRNTV